MKKIFAQLFAFTCLLFMATGAFAQPGVLDQSFGVGGTVAIPSSPQPVDFKIQPDQKILVLSMFTNVASSSGYLLTRLNANGTLDSSFGINGSNKVLKYEQPFALAIQPDGKILVSSTRDRDSFYAPTPYTGYDFSLTRYMPNGSIDNSFGTNGKVLTNFSFGNNYLNDQPISVFVLSNGQILQVGYSTTSSPSLNNFYSFTRFNSNGTVDGSYGVNGKAMIQYSQITSTANYTGFAYPPIKMVMQTNGKIVAVNQRSLTGVTNNGSIDSTFGLNGVATIPLPFEVCKAVVLQPNGKMIFAGGNKNLGVFPNPYYTSMYRYNSNGSLDTSFYNGNPITSLTDNGHWDFYSTLMVEPSGNILLGFGYLGSQLVRCKPNGVLDSSYGKRGIVTIFSNNRQFTSAALQTDGKVVMGINPGFIAGSTSTVMRVEKNALVYYNSLVIKIFYDLNRNGVQDANETPVRGAVVTSIKPGVDTVNSYAYNGYLSDVDTGTYKHSIKNFSLPYYTIVPAIKTTSHYTYFNTDSISFAAQPVRSVRDLSVRLIPLRNAKAGFHTYYLLQVHNTGTDTAAAVVLKLVKSNKLNYNAALPTPTTNFADTLTWTIASLLPRQDSSILIDFIVKAPPAANAGDTLLSVATVVSNKPDSTLADNTNTLSQIVRNAYDPNDKTEAHVGKIKLSKATAGEYLTYTIRFQNTGNDTAFNVYIRDTMDSKLDWNSLQIVASSHNYQMTMNDGKCQFTFPLIKLVDSIKNEPKSHGYIVYKIKIKPNVQIGDVIKNTAAIYFDYNLPIITNTEMTTIVADVLPLKLLSFTAKKQDKTNLLQWTTANEINVDRFEVERSNNGREFNKIGTVKAGNTGYSFTDKIPFISSNYYRLKMLDKDGQFTFSPIRSLTINNSPFTISIYPNPAKDNLQIQVESNKKAAFYLQVVSSDGKVLLVSRLTSNEGTTFRNLYISKLPKGSYLLKVVSNNSALDGREADKESVLRFEKL